MHRFELAVLSHLKFKLQPDRIELELVLCYVES